MEILSREEFVAGFYSFGKGNPMVLVVKGTISLIRKRILKGLLMVKTTTSSLTWSFEIKWTIIIIAIWPFAHILRTVSDIWLLQPYHICHNLHTNVLGYKMFTYMKILKFGFKYLGILLRVPQILKLADTPLACGGVWREYKPVFCLSRLAWYNMHNGPKFNRRE